MAKQSKLTHKTQAARMLTALGWEVADVEKWIPRTNVRQDLFGFADLLCVKGDTTLAVQVCSIRAGGGGDVASHQTKMLSEPLLAKCLEAGWLVELWGLRNNPQPGQPSVRVQSFELFGADQIIVYEGSEVLVPIERSA